MPSRLYEIRRGGSRGVNLAVVRGAVVAVKIFVLVAPRGGQLLPVHGGEGFHVKRRRNAIASSRLGNAASIFAPVLNRI
jgi:hypothetical protein